MGKSSFRIGQLSVTLILISGDKLCHWLVANERKHSAPYHQTIKPQSRRTTEPLGSSKAKTKWKPVYETAKSISTLNVTMVRAMFSKSPTQIGANFFAREKAEQLTASITHFGHPLWKCSLRIHLAPIKEPPKMSKKARHPLPFSIDMCPTAAGCKVLGALNPSIYYVTSPLNPSMSLNPIDWYAEGVSACRKYLQTFALNFIPIINSTFTHKYANCQLTPASKNVDAGKFG